MVNYATQCMLCMLEVLQQWIRAFVILERDSCALKVHQGAVSGAREYECEMGQNVK